MSQENNNHEDNNTGLQNAQHSTMSIEDVPRSGELMANQVRFCDSTGVNVDLCYETFGVPEHPALLLLMGLNRQMVMWDEDQCRMLAAAGFYVIRFDNRDVGLSTKMSSVGTPSTIQLVFPRLCGCCGVRRGYYLEDMALDAFALLDRLKVEKAHLWGVSMGGMIGQTMALMMPERVLTLISMMSTTDPSASPQPGPAVIWELAKKPSKTTTDALIAFNLNLTVKTLATIPNPPIDYIKRVTANYLKRSTYRGMERQMWAIANSNPREPRFKAAKKVPPTLVLHGRDDKLLPMAHAERTRRVIRGSRLHIFDNMGHYMTPDDFERVNDVIVGFIRTQVTSPTA
eukprot:PhM_4_TR11336/c0_g1_i2/m.103957